MLERHNQSPHSPRSVCTNWISEMRAAQREKGSAAASCPFLASSVGSRRKRGRGIQVIAAAELSGPCPGCGSGGLFAQFYHLFGDRLGWRTMPTPGGKAQASEE